ncbi:MAG: tRNA (guanine(26)-N(2))-dimethyltransferase [Desulfurococcales archaeon]|nr:tRNA (guanine(26)-N(2))-dimethyltransferase [Desulfurococcales archaeon]
MRYAVIREGKALIMIPDPGQAIAPHGFEPAWLPVFYNPRMVFNRDVSVVALSIYVEKIAPHKPVRGVDALTGTGVRAVRYLLESSSELVMHANDIDPAAVAVAGRNIELNGLQERATLHRRDARSLLYELPRSEPILFVDIDPFGSPAPFAHAALRAAGHRGLAAFTATDLAVLGGAKRAAARRKYWATVVKAPEHREIGLRVLLGYAARVAASSDKSVRPLLAYYADHYYRVFLLVERGARKADKMLEENVGYAFYCPEKGLTGLEPKCGDPTRIGPLWTGPLMDVSFARDMLQAARGAFSYLQAGHRLLRLLSTLIEEASTCQRCIYYSLPSLASKARIGRLPKIIRVIDRLRSIGYPAARTHFDPMGVRSPAPPEEVIDALGAA